MSYPLAIAAPQVGARSETFVRRHMEDLLPKATVVLTYSVSGPYAGHWSVDAPTLVCPVQVPVQSWRAKFGQTREKWAIQQFLKRHQVEVMLGEYLNYSYDFFQLAQEFNIPYFAHAHGYDASGALRESKWQEAYLKYQQAAGIITVSQSSRARLIELGLDAKKIHVIPCCVDVPEQPRQRSEQEFVRCLAVGRMVAKKAPILLLEAFRQALQVCPNLRLDYVGTGDLLPAVQQFIHVFHLSDRATVHGVQLPETVQQLMEAADIFLQHSMTDPISGDEEGLPVGILEAMAAALPVVSTFHAGIPEAVCDGKTGFLVDEGDCWTMAQRIVTLAKNPKLRLEMGVAGWQRVREKFTWEQEKSSLLQVMNITA